MRTFVPVNAAIVNLHPTDASHAYRGRYATRFPGLTIAPAALVNAMSTLLEPAGSNG